MKQLLIFATHAEAKETIRLLKERNHNYSLHIMGMGNDLTIDLSSFTHIWNLGLAGALNPSYTIGQKIEIQSIAKENHPLIQINKTGARLLTSDTPLHNANLKKALSPHYDLVDMEGYAIAKAAQKANIPCRMTKIISDFAEEGGSALIKQQLPALSIHMADWIEIQLSVEC